MATRPTAKAAAAARKATTAVKPSPPHAQTPAPAVPARNAAKDSLSSDYEGVRQLLSRYCVLIDHGKLVELSELYHRKAIFSVSFDSVKNHAGRDAILAWYTRFFYEPPRKVRHPRHKLFEPYIVVNGNTATASTYFDSDFVESTGAVRILAGRYDDVVIKERGRWLFKERTITVCYHYSPGQGQEGMAP